MPYRLVSSYRHSGGFFFSILTVYAIHRSWTKMTPKLEAKFPPEASVILYKSIGYDIKSQKNLILNKTAAGTQNIASTDISTASKITRLGGSRSQISHPWPRLSEVHPALEVFFPCTNPGHDTCSHSYVQDMWGPTHKISLSLFVQIIDHAKCAKCLCRFIGNIQSSKTSEFNTTSANFVLVTEEESSYTGCLRIKAIFKYPRICNMQHHVHFFFL
jgi:hypothetical protein